MMEIDSLTGKALGIAVAKAMGWREGREWQDKDVAVWFDDGCDVVHVLRRDSHGNVRLGGWAPWRDMNDCWQVVEKMRADGLQLEMGTGPTVCWAKFWRELTPQPEEVDGNICEAILRAALKAMRDEH